MTSEAGEAPRSLTREMLSRDPIAQFREWLADATRRSGQRDPNAMCLSTVAEDGMPQGRMVLLKEADDRGFVFYTNLGSAKGRALAVHPRAALTFHWDRLGRQVRVEGEVERVTDAEADAYYSSRFRESRLGAWASKQSAPLASREELEARVAEFDARFPGDDIPRPPHWSGFRVVPVRVEFWQDRPGRLHDRFRYSRATGGGWEVVRLSP
jgi:pyridoxamine 5'-phosphate oxidase